VKELDSEHCVGISKRELIERLGGSNVLLNLAYSIHPPLLLKFERRIFCDLDPSEIFYWMTKLEMGQSYHHEFWTIGLNVHGIDCQLPKPVVPPTGRPLQWKTFYPLVDTKLYRPQRRPNTAKFATVGQWYWRGVRGFVENFLYLKKNSGSELYWYLQGHIQRPGLKRAIKIVGGARKGNDSNSGVEKLPIRTGLRVRRPLTAVTWPAHLL